MAPRTPRTRCPEMRRLISTARTIENDIRRLGSAVATEEMERVAFSMASTLRGRMAQLNDEFRLP